MVFFDGLSLFLIVFWKFAMIAFPSFYFLIYIGSLLHLLSLTSEYLSYLVSLTSEILNFINCKSKADEFFYDKSVFNQGGWKVLRSPCSFLGRWKLQVLFLLHFNFLSHQSSASQIIKQDVDLICFQVRSSNCLFIWSSKATKRTIWWECLCNLMKCMFVIALYGKVIRTWIEIMKTFYWNFVSSKSCGCIKWDIPNAKGELTKFAWSRTVHQLNYSNLLL